MLPNPIFDMVTLTKPTVQKQKHKNKQKHNNILKTINICSPKKSVTNVTKPKIKTSNNGKVLKIQFDYARMLRYKTLPCYHQNPIISIYTKKTRYSKVTKLQSNAGNMVTW